ncbi:MAG: phosphate regulon transcriptional regulatory protein PhoB [Betaproteobacteria bacterium RIFCSPLOWO2_12_FULL_67_28]|nr:MAG: phosphate regulon transcriptional regulatory protein PhoB [Betaproteobacteria bacterium RIFCSPLOWO2_02_FULL_68_150]OGA58688.1 MAG: phosphate regulon transcriptional regulatory protein PhoB [Betaproteobacteria bacterium RIFCSPLOWO2_12_FULL_67_28]
MANPVRVLVVEDEPAILELIAINLEHAGFAPLRAASAEEAAHLLRQTLPDAALLDWMLPGQSGLALARKLRAEARTRELPIIFLTARSGESDKVAALEAGADDYLTKPFSARELIARIRAVLRRRAPQLGDQPVEISGLRLDPGAHEVHGNGRGLELSPTEFRLLHFLMTHPNRVYSRSKLLDGVWGDDAVVEERTVDVHVRRLRQALAPSGHDALVETVRGSGYLLRGGARP